jgi:hypothetical protein
MTVRPHGSPSPARLSPSERSPFDPPRRPEETALSNAVHVEHLPDQHCFQAEVDGEVGRAEYRMRGKTMAMTHTVVPPAIEGRGVAARLVEAAFKHAKAHGLKIDPQCAYVAAYMQRHPDTQDLRA